MTTIYHGKKYRFNGFDELWQFYRNILSAERESLHANTI